VKSHLMMVIISQLW